MNKRRIIVVLSGLICMLLLFTLYVVYIRSKISYEKTRYEYIAKDKADHIVASIDGVIVRTDTLKYMISHHNGDTDCFEDVADDIFNSVLRDTGIALKSLTIAPEGVVSDVYPLETNHQLIGYDYFDVTIPGNVTSMSVYDTGRTYLINKYDNSSGSYGIIGTTPVFIGNSSDSRLWGLVGIDMDYEDIEQAIKIDSLKDMDINYRLSYIDSHNTRHIIEESEDPIKDEVSIVFDLYNITWELALSPRKGWYPYSNCIIFTLFISLASVFLALFVDTIFKLRESYATVIKMSNTDKLTDCFNRRAYEEKLLEFERNGLNDKFVYIQVDINGLKKANDNLGHEAGDELIIGASDLLKNCFRDYGGVYRTGGDEFAVLIHIDADKLEERKQTLERSMAKWKGQKVPNLSMSLGYALRTEFPDKNIHEIAKIADQRMYEAKHEFYVKSGMDRRKR